MIVIRSKGRRGGRPGSSFEAFQQELRGAEIEVTAAGILEHRDLLGRAAAGDGATGKLEEIAADVVGRERSGGDGLAELAGLLQR